MQQARAASMLFELLEILPAQAADVLAHVRADDRLMWLLARAAQAAAESVVEAEVTGLARAVAPAWSDDAQIDDALYGVWRDPLVRLGMRVWGHCFCLTPQYSAGPSAAAD